MSMSRREIREHIFKILFGIDFYGEPQMQEQMAKQAGTLFQGIPGMPGTKRP